MDPLHHIFLIIPFRLCPGKFFPQLCQFLLQNRKPLPAEIVSFFFQGSLFDLQLHDMTLYIVQLRRQGIQFGLDQGTCLIHKIDGFIRKKTVGDVAV